MDNPDSSSPAPMSGNDRPLIVGLGEALVDRLPAGEVIGGAPLSDELMMLATAQASAGGSR